MFSGGPQAFKNAFTVWSAICYRREREEILIWPDFGPILYHRPDHLVLLLAQANPNPLNPNPTFHTPVPNGNFNPIK